MIPDDEPFIIERTEDGDIRIMLPGDSDEATEDWLEQNEVSLGDAARGYVRGWFMNVFDGIDRRPTFVANAKDGHLLAIPWERAIRVFGKPSTT